MNFCFEFLQELSIIETQCFITYQTPRRELKIRREAGYLTNFEVFDIVMKHCDECLTSLLKQTDFEGEIKDAKTRSFSSDIQTHHGARFPLSFGLLMSLRIIDQKSVILNINQ